MNETYDRRKRQLRKAFVVVAAAAATAVTAGGCGNGNSPFDDDDGRTVNPPPPNCEEANNCLPQECPDNVPLDGAPCAGDLTCFYDDFDLCGTEAFCASGAWQVWDTTCNPPPPECPAEMPEAGTACPDEGFGPPYCFYDVELTCGSASVEMTCDYVDGSSVWVTFGQLPVCGGESCQTLSDANACALDSGCQWLVPGCADPGGETEIPEGCYPIEDCAQTGCGDWGTCLMEGVFDPCHDSPCAACGAQANVCLPNPT